MPIELRRVVNGKVYDTSTAEHVAVITRRGTGTGDFRFEETDLYRSPKGAWFLAGEGGASSRWRQRAKDDNGDVEGQGIEVIEADQARLMLEQVDGPVETYFEVEEG